MVDFSALNDTVSGTFCDKTAIWGNANIDVVLDIEPTVDEETYRIAGKLITAGCLSAGIEAMKRGDVLIIESVKYSVLSVHRDTTGWATITLEEA